MKRMLLILSLLLPLFASAPAVAIAQPTPIVQSVVYGGNEGGPLLGSGCNQPLAITFCKDLAGRDFLCECGLGVGGRWIWIKAVCV